MGLKCVEYYLFFGDQTENLFMRGTKVLIPLFLKKCTRLMYGNYFGVIRFTIQIKTPHHPAKAFSQSRHLLE